MRKKKTFGKIVFVVAVSLLAINAVTNSVSTVDAAKITKDNFGRIADTPRFGGNGGAGNSVEVGKYHGGWQINLGLR